MLGLFKHPTDIGHVRLKSFTISYFWSFHVSS